MPKHSKEDVLLLKSMVNKFVELDNKADKFKEALKLEQERYEKFNSLIEVFLEKVNKSTLSFGKKINIEKKHMVRTLPASKKYLKERTLELCEGDEEKMEMLFESLFSKDNLEEYEVKKIKIADPNKPKKKRGRPKKVKDEEKEEKEE